MPESEGVSPDRDWRSAWAAIVLVRPDSRGLSLIVWLTAATASMAAAGVVAIQPGHLADLWLVREWLHHWFEAGNPYLEFLGEIDYPPLSFLVLWPIGVPSDRAIVWLFIPGAIATMALAGVVLVQWLASRLAITLTWQAQAALVALMMAGGAARGGIWRGQTAALAVLFGALALRWCRERPVLSATALALCAYKPHVAVGFGLAIALTERRDVIVGAAAVVGLLSAMFAATIDQTLAEITALYAHSLQALYDGPDRVRGLLSVRWVIEDVSGDYDRGTAIYAVAACASLVLMGIAAVKRRHPADRAALAAICLLWPLVFLPNQLYHGVLAWPAVWLVMWPESGLIRRHGVRLALATALILFPVLDVPRTFRLLVAHDPELVMAAYRLSPLRMALLFAFMLYALKTRQPSRRGSLL